MSFWNRVLNKKNLYDYQGMVYLDKNNNPVANEITDKVQWKDKIQVTAYSRNEAGILAFEMFHFKYPELIGKIWLF